MVWFVMIVRVAAKVVAGKGADDTRSDDECEADGDDDDGDVYFEDDEVEVKKKSVPVFVSEAKRRTILPQSAYLSENRQGGNVGGGVVRRRPSPMSKVSKRKTGAGGAASLADRKDLLGRIGCDKPT